MKENNFTIEQLEKIIDEVHEGAVYYRDGNYYTSKLSGYFAALCHKLTDLQKQLEEMKMQESTQETRMTVKEFLYSGRKFHFDDEVLDVHGDRRTFKNQTSVDHWNSSVDRVSDCCLVISAKELQPEFNNTAQQVESLGSAMAMSGCDIKCALKLRYMDEISIDGYSDNEWVYGCTVPDSELSVVFKKETASHMTIPTDRCTKLTPAQKQQKIDEQNGELFYEVVKAIKLEVYGDAYCSSESLSIDNEKCYVELAKQVSFKGKLESI